MTHGANTAFVGALGARHLQLRLGDGALPVVSRGRRMATANPRSTLACI